MPLVKRTVEPVHICATNAVKAGIKDVRDELEFISVATLASIVRQLGSLSAHVDDMFNELCREAMAITGRTMALSERAERLKIKITQLNPTVEEVLLQDINTRKPFKSSVIKDQQVMSLATRPFAITEVYQRCEPPPPLQKLNPYRQDGKDSLKFYTEPGYFFELWCQAMQKDAAKNQQRRNKRQKRGPYMPQTIEDAKEVSKEAQKSTSRQPTQIASTKMPNTVGDGQRVVGTVTLRSSTVANGHPQSRPSSLELQNGLVSLASLASAGQLSSAGDAEIAAAGPPTTIVQNSATSAMSVSVINSITSQPTVVSKPASSRVEHAEAGPNEVVNSSKIPVESIGINSNSNSRACNVQLLAGESLPRMPSQLVSGINHKSALDAIVSRSNAIFLPSPPPTPPSLQKKRESHLVSSVSSGGPKSESHGDVKTSTPDSVLDFLPPPPTPPPQFCSSSLLDSPGTVLPPPPLNEDSYFDAIPPSISPPPPMSPTMENAALSITNGKDEGSAGAGSACLEPAASCVNEGLSITSDDSPAALSSGSASKLDEVNKVTDSEQPLVRDTRSDLLAAIRQGIQLRKVEERRLRTQKHRPVNHLDVQSLMEAAFELRRKALEENDSDDEQEEADELNGNWSDAE